MSQRRLALELDLDSGSFTAKMRQAGRETEIFQRKIETTDASLRRIDRGVNGATAKLRDFVLVMGNLRSAVENARFFFTGLAEAAVGATAEVERTIFLLRGLSKETSEFGRNREAQQNLESLMDTAKKAPFSLQALSDTFVKFKAGGLDPTNGSMQSLVDAVAAFGGSDELLKRASVAIQQMGGKGVVSMEELRQQLGEAVPTAISLMAKGLGKSYNDLVKEISLGKVRAGPALEAMFEQFQLAFGGKAEQMMNTFQGRVAGLKSELVKLALAFTGMDTAGNVADGSLYDYLKDALKDITTLVASKEFQNGFAEFGSLIGSTAGSIGEFVGNVGNVASLIPVMNNLKDVFLLASLALVGRFAGAGGAALTAFAGKAIQDAQRTMAAVNAERRVREAAAQAPLIAARNEKTSADAAVNASRIRQAALMAEARQLQVNMALAQAQLAAANRQAQTGRGPNGQFASRADGEAARVNATNLLADAGRRLTAVNAELMVVDTRLALETDRLTGATTRLNTITAQGTVLQRAKASATTMLTNALRAANAGYLAAAGGASKLVAALVSLSTAQGRAAAGARALSLAQGIANGTMMAGSLAARGLGVALGFFGGPLGIAIMAVFAAISSVTGAINDAKKALEDTNLLMQDSATILNRLAQEGLIASDSIYDAGTSSEYAAQQLNTVNREAMAAANSLYEYAKAAREAAMAELLQEKSKVIGELTKVQGQSLSSTRRGARDEMSFDSERHAGSLSESWNRLWGFIGNEGANLWTNGQANRDNEYAQRRLTNRAYELQSAYDQVARSSDSRYQSAFAARGPAAGSTPVEGGSSGGGGGGGRGGGRQGQSPDERGMARVVDMLESVKGIEADIAGAGKEAAKLAFVLDRDPAMAGISETIKANMMAAAEALDLANNRAEGFRALQGLTEEAEKQEQSAAGLRSEIALILAGQQDMVVENARYGAGLADNVTTASQYSQTEAEAAANRAKIAQRETTELTKQRDAMSELQRMSAASATAAQDAFADYTSGANESDRELNRYRRSLMVLVNTVPALTDEWTRAKAAADQAVDNFRLERAAEAMIEMRRETAQLVAELSGDRNAGARNSLQEQLETQRAIVAATKEGTAERMQAEAVYYAWKEAKEREFAMQTNPLLAQMTSWKDTMGSIMDASGGWMDGFVNSIGEGRDAFDDFGKGILKELEKVILKALIAHLILSAIGMITGKPAASTSGIEGLTGKLNAGAMPGVRVPGQHGGGITGMEATFTRTVDPSLFNGAPRMHDGGIAGLKPSEVPTILQKKEGVFTPEQMANLAPANSGTGIPNISVNVINESGTPMDAQQQGGGRFDGRNYILDVVIDAASKPGKMRDALKGVGG